MRSSLIAVVVSFFACSAISAVVDEYALSLVLKVPVVQDNMQSMGRRVFKTQRLKGTASIRYEDGRSPVLSIKYLVNKSYKVAGQSVTYSVWTDNLVWNAIGSNKTGQFNKAVVAFSMDADPSYNVGADEPDNTLILTFAGTGRQKGSLSGYAAGQLGCGCYAYGHISPTRILGPDGATATVSDIAACFGTWRMTFRSRHQEP